MRFSFFALSFFGCFLTLPARADSVNVQLFKSPFNLNYGTVESAIHDNLPWDEAAERPRYFFSSDYHYVKDPLVLINTSTNTRVRSLVTSVHTLDLSLGYFVDPDFSVYAQLPLNFSKLPDSTSQFGLGDSRVAGKFSVGERLGSLHFSVMPELILPSGDKARFLSDDGLGLGALLIAENDFGSFRMTGNLGFRYNARAQGSGIDYRKRLPIGIGAAIPVARNWLVNIEANGALAFPTSQRQNASEFYGGVMYHPVKYVAWIAGASLGAFDKAGASDYRLQAAFRMYFQEKEQKKKEEAKYEEPEPLPPPTARMAEDHIEISEEVQFDHNRDTLKPRSQRLLDKVAEIIRDHADSIDHVEVEGHTSPPGTDAYNLKLSWRRARAVVAYLVHEQKIPAKLLRPMGYGESRPKFKPGRASPAQLELNRRVEFKVVRKKAKAPISRKV